VLEERGLVYSLKGELSQEVWISLQLKRGGWILPIGAYGGLVQRVVGVEVVEGLASIVLEG
jgi:hypothetical protein